MKIIALGDTHGRDVWKKIVGSEKDADKIIFIGDYFDTHENIGVEQQINNFIDICAFKKANFNKVILLIGNHDYHYMRGVNEQYSGFQHAHCLTIQEYLEKAIKDDYLQMAYRYDDILFTHAGVTKTWATTHQITVPPDEGINTLFKQNLKPFRFQPGRNFSNYGNDVTQPPIWVRPESLLIDMLDGFKQVVGHTSPDRLKLDGVYGSAGLILIDTFGTSEEYLRITDGKMEAVKYE